MQKCKTCERALDKFGRLLPRPNPDGYISPLVAVDAVVVKNLEGKNKVLLIKRRKLPGIGKFAFPGGHVNYGEKLEDACLRELKEECNLNGTIKSLISVHGDPLRDQRKHYVSAFYEVEVEKINELNAGDDASDAAFLEIADVYNKPDLFAFEDHLEIVRKIHEMHNENMKI